MHQAGPPLRVILQPPREPVWATAPRTREEVEFACCPTHCQGKHERTHCGDERQAYGRQKFIVIAKPPTVDAFHWVDGEELKIQGVKRRHEIDKDLRPADARKTADRTKALRISEADLGEARADGEEMRRAPPKG